MGSIMIPGPDGAPREYIPVAQRLPAFLRAFPIGEYALRFQERRFAKRTWIFEAKLVRASDGVELASGAVIRVLEAATDWSRGRVAAMNALMGVLGFGSDTLLKLEGEDIRDFPHPLSDEEAGEKPSPEDGEPLSPSPEDSEGDSAPPEAPAPKASAPPGGSAAGGETPPAAPAAPSPSSEGPGRKLTAGDESLLRQYRAALVREGWAKEAVDALGFEEAKQAYLEVMRAKIAARASGGGPKKADKADGEGA